MTEQFQASIPEMRSAAAHINARADDLAKRIANLDNTVGAELLVDGWRGMAASAYDESWVEWKAGAHKFVEALRNSADAVATAANELETLDAGRKVQILNLGERL